MRTKQIIGSLLIVFLCVPLSHLYAQNNYTINVINQYYHNWLGGVNDVDIDNDLAYVACDDDGLRIININNLDAIFDVGQFVADGAVSITVNGDYAFLGTETGLLIIDVSNPVMPVEVYSNTSLWYVLETEIVGNTAFIGNYNGVTILDISNINQPQTLWSSTDIDYVGALEIRGNLAYIASESPGLVVMDITSLNAPGLLYTYQPAGYNYVNGLDVQGNYAYMASGWNGMEVFDLTTQQVVASIDSLVWAFRVEVEGNYAYMTYGDPDCPFAIIDISDPHSPQTMGIYYPPEDLINFTVVDEVAYMADFAHGLRMVDISTPSNPIESHIYSRYGLDKDVIVRGDYAYVRENIKFKIINISDLQNPFETGYFEFGWGYNDIHLVDDVAFLSQGGYNCLYSLDISDPYSPDLIDVYRDDDTDVHYRMRLYGDYAYIVENGGLEIVDISDPAEMVHVGNYFEDIGNAKIEISSHYLFLKSSHYYNPLKAFDIINPLSPALVTSFDLDDYPLQMKAANGYLYLITYQQLLIFDITDFSNWAPITTVQIFSDERRLTDIEIEGNDAFLTCSEGGLYLYDLSDLANPIYTAYAATPGSADGLFAMDGIAYVADGSNLGFYDCTAVTGIEDENQILPASLTLISNYPNPFNSSTNVKFVLTSPVNVKLDVFDILGRNITTIVDGTFNEGEHTVNWNGKNISGQQVASGRYFIKADFNNHIESLPVTLLK